MNTGEFFGVGRQEFELGGGIIVSIWGQQGFIFRSGQHTRSLERLTAFVLVQLAKSWGGNRQNASLAGKVTETTVGVVRFQQKFIVAVQLYPQFAADLRFVAINQVFRRRNIAHHAAKSVLMVARNPANRLEIAWEADPVAVGLRGLRVPGWHWSCQPRSRSSWK